MVHIIKVYFKEKLCVCVCVCACVRVLPDEIW
jgi:hypothetical protein